MLNRYPLWKYLMVVVVIALGAIYATPNIYPDDPAIQISGSSSATTNDELVLKRVVGALDKAGVEYKASELTEKNVLIRFNDSNAQIYAKTVVTEALGDDYLVALDRAPTTPQWLLNWGAKPMNLGLDLRGGVHFLLEVDMPKALSQKLELYVGEIKNRLREEKIRYRLVDVDAGKLIVKFAKVEARSEAESLLRSEYTEFRYEDIDKDEAYFLQLSLSDNKVSEIESYAIEQNLTTLRNRVNELGIAEPVVQRQGRNRIVVELAGCTDAALCKKIIGKTANLEFRLEAKPDELVSRTEQYNFRDKKAVPSSAIIEKNIIVTGSSVANASASFDENGQSQVNITLDAKGGKMLNRVSRNAVKRRMAVLFIEHKTRVSFKEVDGKVVQERHQTVEKSIISLATIQTALGNRFRITGLDSPQEASELALLLRAGSLAAPIYFVEERTVGPSLGQENIDLGMKSVQIGLILVAIFMLLYYRVFGLYANIALGINMVLLLAVMSILSATLTLPGIAGIVLTVGMAVDANVLIFARIREELKNGLPPQSAIHAGYERAFETIFDANVTTLLVALILFAVGTGPVKGFAVTLSIGILTSMFTAVVVTRAMVNLTYGQRNIKKLWI